MKNVRGLRGNGTRSGEKRGTGALRICRKRGGATTRAGIAKLAGRFGQRGGIRVGIRGGIRIEREAHRRRGREEARRGRFLTRGVPSRQAALEGPRYGTHDAWGRRSG